MKQPDYKRIYTDMLETKYPEKRAVCNSILNQNELCFMDVLRLNELIFDKKSKESKEIDQRYRSYNKRTILKILRYQKDNGLSNTQTANYFKMSRNTISSWKKLFVLE